MSDNEKIPEPIASQGFFASLVDEIIYSPVNLLLTTIIVVLIYKIWKSKYSRVIVEEAPPPPLPKLRKDMTVAELKQYDGTQPDGRVLVAVNGFVFDVTKGKRHYGPGGSYSAFGGRDASRGLATFVVSASSENSYDDLSDLNAAEMESVREWEMQFKEKYDLVGKLLKPGEEPTNYSDEDVEEPEASANTTPEEKKKE